MTKSFRFALPLALFLALMVGCSIPATPPLATAIPATATPAPTAFQNAVVVPTQTASPAALATPNNVAFDGRRALRHVQVLAGDIGRRPAGSESAHTAAEYLHTQLESYGYQVTEQRFPFLGFQDKGTALALVAPLSKSLDATPLIYSPSGHLRAPVVSVPGAGRSEDYSGLDAKGKIALVQRGQIYLRDKARNAAQAGAAAVLIYSTDSPGYVGTLQERAAIPTLVVSTEDARDLLEKVAQGPVTLQLDSETEIGPTQGANVVATRPGTNRDILVFGAHYDSVHNSPGGDDNASGAAVVLELARVFSETDRPETLVFIGFDAEEPGLIGSQAYVSQLSNEERRRIRVMFDFDELGVTDNRLDISGTTDWVNRAVVAGQRLGANPRANNLGGSDHDSFLRAGIPAVFIYREDPLFHTRQDTPERVKADWLAIAGRLAMEMINR